VSFDRNNCGGFSRQFNLFGDPRFVLSKDSVHLAQ